MKSKKVLILGTSLVVILALVVGSMTLLATEDERDKATGVTSKSEILARAAEILGIEEGELADALNEAHLQVAFERIDKKVEEGWVGEKQADQLKQNLKERLEEGNLAPVKFMGRFGHFRGCGKFPGGSMNRRFLGRRDG